MSQMKSWDEFMTAQPDLAEIGRKLLFPGRARVGGAFLATLRKDGAPRLHPVSLVYWKECLYVFIPLSSPKCADLQRDGRYALQAFPPPNNTLGEEFYVSGVAVCIQDPAFRQAMIAETEIRVEKDEVLFELFLDRVMYTKLIYQDHQGGQAWHQIWRSQSSEHFYKE
jgi:hypothetical protein